jgi:hypothetical protein
MHWAGARSIFKIESEEIHDFKTTTSRVEAASQETYHYHQDRRYHSDSQNSSK